MRPMVSYEDISPMTTDSISPQRPPHSQPSPSKKRKKANQQAPKHLSQHVQHWDEPGNTDEVMLFNEIATSCDADISAVKDDEKTEEEESRELTYEEIWDDSALINAWNAATEEYEAFHGSNKDWKQAPVHKSPLWYNVPPPSRIKQSSLKSPVGPASKPSVSNAESEGEDMDSKPFNFDTFVPNHDPSLTLPVPPYLSGPLLEYSGHHQQAPPGPSVSQDEAFTRAMGAMYWAGYYSAIYYSHRSKCPPEDETGEQEVDEDHDQKQEGDEVLLSTQR